MTGLTDYAGWLYAQPGMQELLLGLQDEAGQDVLLLLTACWLGQRRVSAEPELWLSLHAAQTPWREKVIQPLRQVRRHLAGNSAATALYEQTKACELSAEGHQLAVLERLCVGGAGTAQAPQACIAAHLVQCCGELGGGRLQELAAAAAEFARPR